MNSRSPADLFAELDQYDQQIPLGELKDWLERAELTADDVAGFIRFHPDRYLRNLMHAGSAYQALVLCWRNGQRSPIHDHASSHCALKIMQGVATETVFEFAPNEMVYPVSSRSLPTGSVCGNRGCDIHQVSNLQPGDADLVTLHIYSPPLLTMSAFSLHDARVSQFLDPVNDEFVSGAGI